MIKSLASIHMQFIFIYRILHIEPEKKIPILALHNPQQWIELKKKLLFTTYSPTMDTYHLISVYVISKSIRSKYAAGST